MNREVDSKRTFPKSLKWGGEKTSSLEWVSVFCAAQQGLVEGSGDNPTAHLLWASGAGSGRVPVCHHFLGLSIKPWIPFPSSVSPSESYLLGKMHSGWALNSLLKWEERILKNLKVIRMRLTRGKLSEIHEKIYTCVKQVGREETVTHLVCMFNHASEFT